MNERRRLSEKSYGVLSVSTNLITAYADGHMSSFYVYIGGSSSINRNDISITTSGITFYDNTLSYDAVNVWYGSIDPNYSLSDYVFGTIIVTHVPSGLVLEIQVTQEPELFWGYQLLPTSIENINLTVEDNLDTSHEYALRVQLSSYTFGEIPVLTSLICSADINFNYGEYYTSGRTVVLNTYKETLTANNSTLTSNSVMIDVDLSSSSPIVLKVDHIPKFYTFRGNTFTKIIDGNEFNFFLSGAIEEMKYGSTKFSEKLNVGESGYAKYDNIHILVHGQNVDDYYNNHIPYSGYLDPIYDITPDSYPVYTFTVTRKNYENPSYKREIYFTISKSLV